MAPDPDISQVQEANSSLVQEEDNEVEEDLEEVLPFTRFVAGEDIEDDIDDYDYDDDDINTSIPPRQKNGLSVFQSRQEILKLR
jgi:hypothetical protein